MGACEVTAMREGTSARDVYKKLVRDCEIEYGCDSYNGTFSTCSLTRVHNLFSTYKKGNEKKAWDFLGKRDIDKWEAEAVDLGVKSYRITKPHIKKTSAVTLKYGISYHNQSLDSKLRHYNTLEEAKKVATETALKNHCTVTILKGYVDARGSSGIGEVTLETKEYTRKPKSIPKGATLEEIHVYCFLGWAAE